ncbi:hypothetical protein ACFE04_019555 [Oxalis oulophora]
MASEWDAIDPLDAIMVGFTKCRDAIMAAKNDQNGAGTARNGIDQNRTKTFVHLLPPASSLLRLGSFLDSRAPSIILAATGRVVAAVASWWPGAAECRRRRRKRKKGELRGGTAAEGPGRPRAEFPVGGGSCAHRSSLVVLALAVALRGCGTHRLNWSEPWLVNIWLNSYSYPLPCSPSSAAWVRCMLRFTTAVVPPSTISNQTLSCAAIINVNPLAPTFRRRRSPLKNASLLRISPSPGYLLFDRWLQLPPTRCLGYPRSLGVYLRVLPTYLLMSGGEKTIRCDEDRETTPQGESECVENGIRGEALSLTFQ